MRNAVTPCLDSVHHKPSYPICVERLGSSPCLSVSVAEIDRRTISKGGRLAALILSAVIPECFHRESRGSKFVEWGRAESLPPNDVIGGEGMIVSCILSLVSCLLYPESCILLLNPCFSPSLVLLSFHREALPGITCPFIILPRSIQ